MIALAREEARRESLSIEYTHTSYTELGMFEEPLLSHEGCDVTAGA